MPAAPPPRPFGVEVPEVERVGIDLPPGVDLPRPDHATEDLAGPSPIAARPPLPSYAVATIGGLLLLCLALSAALLVAVQDAPPVAAAPKPDTSALPASADLDTAFTADPSPIPVDLLTRLEEASAEPLDIELTRLLDAIQHGFGRRSVQLEPTLRSYVYRMASRFEWNPDTFRVAVTAPDGDLAAARGATLERLFDDAIASGRLQVGTGVGPDALTLATE